MSVCRILCNSFRLPLKLLILDTKALALAGALRRDSTTSYNLYARSMGSETFQPGRTMFGTGLRGGGRAGVEWVVDKEWRGKHDGSTLIDGKSWYHSLTV